MTIGVVIVGSLLTSAYGGTTTSDRSVTSFRSPTYEYSIELPRGWSAIPAEEELMPDAPPLTGPPITDVFAKRPNRRVSRMSLPALVVGGQPVPEGTGVTEWAAAVRDVVSKQKGCGAPESTRKLDVGDEDAVLLRYPDCPRGTHLDHRWVAVVHGDRAFHFVFFGGPGHGARDRALFRRLISSVAFEPAQE